MDLCGKLDQDDGRPDQLQDPEAGHAPGAIGLELSCASEPEISLDAVEVSAVGSYCVALGAGLVKWWA